MKKFLPAISVAAFFILINAVLLIFFPEWSRESQAERMFGEVIHEETSEFSHIRVREREGVRSLLFVDAKGEEQRQSSVDLDAPAELELLYSRTMFASLLFRKPQEEVLIVGLGGGGMVRFLNEELPAIHVDAVEIDPAVVEVAAEYFGTKNSPQTTIYTADAFVYLREPHGPYDVIYMDAFLKPPTDPGIQELAQRLKTVAFLKDIQARLKPGGIVTFNLIETDASTKSDFAALEEAFPNVYVFEVPRTWNLAVIGSMEEERLSKEELLRRAESLQSKLDIGLDFPAMVAKLREPAP